MRSISHRRLRYGSPRVHRTLRAGGWQVNHKRIERIRREENMQVPKRQHRRRRLPNCGSENSCIRRRALHKDHVWSYDFVIDRGCSVIHSQASSESPVLSVCRAWDTPSAYAVDQRRPKLRLCARSVPTGQSLWPKRCTSGSTRQTSKRCSLPRAASGRTVP
jgi:hypothetical protein